MPESPVSVSPDDPLKSTSIETVRSLMTDFPTHVQHFSQIPCASRSLYTGMFFGGLVGAAAILRTKSISGANYGFLTFLGTSVLSWEYYRYRLRSKQSDINTRPSF